ncbi:hypothetical protein [Rickettsia endosymbiont of Nabis limbatus]|uniref:hypothetical protein n=1 Tax=Rickettsia endosymbiont of Nabis limbatus TaxID=3066268 RepID=UPI003AF349EA
MPKKPNDTDNEFLSPEELAFAEEYDNYHDIAEYTNNDDAQAWAKKLLGESNNTTTNNPTDKA